MIVEIIALKPPPGVWRGIDTAGYDRSPGNVITPKVAARLSGLGFRWVARYTRPDGVVLNNPIPGGDYRGCYSLSIAESRWILEAGLGILGLQFGTYGSVSDYAQYGRAAAESADRLGWPKGIHMHMDIEGRAHQKSGPKRIMAKAEAWAGACNDGGHRSGIYITALLTGRQLYSLKGVTSYWAAGVDGMQTPGKRSFAVEQDPPRGDYPDGDMRLGDKIVAGMLCDTNTLRLDRLRDAPVIVVTYEAAVRWYGDAFMRLGSTFPTAP